MEYTIWNKKRTSGTVIYTKFPRMEFWGIVMLLAVLTEGNANFLLVLSSIMFVITAYFCKSKVYREEAK